MKTSLMIFLCLFFNLFIGFKSSGQSNQKAIDSILSAQFPVGGPSGVVLLAKEGTVMYKKAFGKVNLELNEAMHANNVFRLGSITKQFTAAAILKLAEEGKLSIQDSITKFIVDYPTHGKKITIEHLLTHTSGIKNYTGMGKFTPEVKRKDFSPKQLLDFFKNEPMDFNPGEEYRYSNSGYILLGYIIEIVSGKPYAQYIEDTFFKPLGMDNSYYDTPSKIIINRAPGYKKTNGRFENADFLSMTLPYAAGSLLSNVDDIFIWYQALMNAKVLNAQSLEKAYQSYKLNNGRLTGYGYGWEIGNVQGSPSIKHVGIVNGYVTYVAYLPVEKVFIAIFSNCECMDNPDIPASKAVAMLLGKSYPEQKIELSQKSMESYQAVYNTLYEGKKIVAYQDGHLVYSGLGGQKYTLIPFKKDNFFIKDNLLNLEFERTPRGDIHGFNLSSTGTSYKAVRDPEKIESKKQMNISSKTMEQYVGKYQFAPGFVFQVVKEGTTLYGQVGQDKKELIAFASNKFYARDIDATIIFNLDKKGKVCGLTKIQNSEMKANKID